LGEGDKTASLNPARRQEKGKTPIQEALALWEAGQRVTALKQLEHLKKWDAEAPQEAYRVAKLYANQQQLKKANTWLKILLKEAPLFAPAHYLQGVIYSEWGKLDDALTALRRAVFADPQFVLARFALASLFGRLKQPKRAQKSLNKVTQLLASYDPDAPVSEGDKITAKELGEMVAIQRSLLKNQ
jgi:chemotaxis protein methyltransferase CheR